MTGRTHFTAGLNFEQWHTFLIASEKWCIEKEALCRSFQHSLQQYFFLPKRRRFPEMLKKENLPEQGFQIVDFPGEPSSLASSKLSRQVLLSEDLLDSLRLLLELIYEHDPLPAQSLSNPVSVRDLIVWLPDLQTICQEDDLKVLLKAIESEREKQVPELAHLLEMNRITFDMLPWLLRPNEVLHQICPTTGKSRCFKLVSFEMTDGSNRELIFHCHYFAFDGVTFGAISSTVSQVDFSMAQEISQLEVYPLRFHPESEKIVNRLQRRGQRFLNELKDGTYYYNGLASYMNRTIYINNPVYVSQAMEYRFTSKERLLIMGHVTADPSEVDKSDIVTCPPFISGFDFTTSTFVQLDIDYLSCARWEAPLPTSYLLEDDNCKLLDNMESKKGTPFILFHGLEDGRLLTESFATQQHRPLYNLRLEELCSSSVFNMMRLRHELEIARATDAVVMVTGAEFYITKPRSMLLTISQQLAQSTSIVCVAVPTETNIPREVFRPYSVYMKIKTLDPVARKLLWSHYLGKSETNGLEQLDHGLEQHVLSAYQIRGIARLASCGVSFMKSLARYQAKIYT